jgi:voltage-gated potassium channel
MIHDFVNFTRYALQALRIVSGVIFILLLILLLCAILLARAEGLSFGYTLYFTAVTALTVGYGDITPTTAIGRIVSVVVGVVGVICVGIVVAVATRALERVVADKMD